MQPYEIQCVTTIWIIPYFFSGQFCEYGDDNGKTTDSLETFLSP